MRRIGRTTSVIAATVAVTYTLTWAVGARSARTYLAHQGQARFLPTLPAMQPANGEALRTDFLNDFARMGIPVESRGSLDLAFMRQVPVFPGLVYARLVSCYYGQCMPEAEVASVIAWYGFGSRSLVTGTNHGWQFGHGGG
jgi:hypothetical protein